MRIRGTTVERALIIFCLAGLGVAIVIGVLLFNSNRDSINQSNEALARARESIANNRDLGCRVGGFLVGVPIVKNPQISQADFEKQVDKALEFLHALRKLDCAGLGHVTTAKIAAQEKALEKVVGGGRQSGNHPGQPPGPPSGGPSPKPKPEPPSPDLSICVEHPLLPRCIDLNLP